MSSLNTTISPEINDIKQSMIVSSQICGICLFVIGVIGHTLSIYVFTRRVFRSNPCVCYFLAATLSGCIVVYFNIPLKLLQVGFNIDIFVYSIPMCQSFTYFLNSVRVLPSWFIALSSIDRFLCSSSSVTLRGWSNIRVAYRAIPFTVLFIGLAYIHVPFYNTILLPQRLCSIASNTYRSFFSIWNLIFWSWIPTICMLVFGLLTIRHVRQGRRRIIPQNTGNHLQRNQKKVDRQLIQMLLIQSFVFGSTTTILSIGNLYVSITSNLIVKTDLEKAKDNYLVTVLTWIATIGPCTSFYLFVLSSQLFRREVINLFTGRQPIPTANGITTIDMKQTRN